MVLSHFSQSPLFIIARLTGNRGVRDPVVLEQPEYPSPMLPKMTPMRLDRQAKPFDHPEWLFEVKFDGFRSLAYIEGQCELVSQGIEL